jgi:hypothetical protein
LLELSTSDVVVSAAAVPNNRLLMNEDAGNFNKEQEEHTNCEPSDVNRSLPFCLLYKWPRLTMQAAWIC